MSTLAADLERQRIAHHARRIEQVLVALHERRRERALVGAVPAAPDHTIKDFSSQLVRMQTHLRTAPL